MNWSYLYLTIAIVSEVAGTAALKSAGDFDKPLPILVVLIGYGIAFFCLSLVLRTIPVGIAYAIWAGCGIVLVVVAGYLLFGQRLDAPAIAGISLIIAGVAIVNLFSTSLGH
jgi:small multidrug resistance pump